MQQNDDVEERKEDNNILVKHLVKITNQQIVDLSVKNQAIEKRLQECSLNTTIFMNNNPYHLQTLPKFSIISSFFYELYLHKPLSV